MLLCSFYSEIRFYPSFSMSQETHKQTSEKRGISPAPKGAGEIMRDMDSIYPIRGGYWIFATTAVASSTVTVLLSFMSAARNIAMVVVSKLSYLVL